MRPVEKGTAPQIEFKKYSEAEPFLEERLGAYCSFCEFPIKHVPEVEHKEAKSRGGEALNWNNLLLSCKYCNTRKGVVVKKGEKEKYLWPDEDDTFHCFSYDKGFPKLNRDYLDKQGDDIKMKAENIFHLVKLDNIPIREKDRRFAERNEAYNCAVSSKEGWKKVKDTESREMYLVQIKMLAKATGFFSTWMDVFRDEADIRSTLIEVFKGTKKSIVRISYKAHKIWALYFFKK